MTATTRLSLNKAIAILVFIAASAILIHPISAQDSTKSAIRQENIAQRIETRKEALDTKKAELDNRLATIKEKMASREAELKTKLNAFKDKKKAEIAARVNTNLNQINQNQTTQMQMYLDKMTQLLNKLEDRVNQRTPDIKDPQGAKAAIAIARQNIATASAAVTAQSEKDYTITITSESKVRADAQKMRDSLKTDLMALRKTVIDAKQSVSNAVRVARASIKEGTPSGQQ